MDFYTFITKYYPAQKVDYWKKLFSIFKELKENGKKDYKKIAVKYNTSHENIRAIAKRLTDRNLL